MNSGGMRYLLLYKKSTLWFLFLQFWRFWLVLFFWLVATVAALLVLGLISGFVFEGKLSPDAARRVLDIGYWVGLSLSIGAFSVYFLRTIHKAREVWVGTVIKLQAIERTGETHDYQEFSLLLATGAGEKQFDLDMAPFSVLQEGMKIEMVYDTVIGDALRIKQVG